MAKTKKVGSTGRFGARYGSTIRKRVREIEDKSKAIYKCPVCYMRTLKRSGLGIFACSNCGEKFTGGAWEPNTSAGRSITRRVTRIAEGLKEEE